MTNNHCPEFPARKAMTRGNEIKIAEFAEKMQDIITEFAEEFSMDDGIRIYTDNWADCARCESAVIDCAHQVMTSVLSEVMSFLNSNIVA